MTQESAFARSGADWLLEGRRHDLAGRMLEAVECFSAAIDRASGGHAPRVLAEALRRLGVLHHVRGDRQAAYDLCQRSYDLAQEGEMTDLATEALNALAGFDFEQGLISQALARYYTALELAAKTPSLVAKVEHNLATVASVRGDWRSAAEHFAQSLAASEEERDHRGCAFAHHNLGRLHADQKRWAEAHRYYRNCERLAEAAGDRHLQGLASLNLAEVYVALGQYDAALRCADAALETVSQFDARRDRAAAHRILGVIYREMDRTTLAESHLRSALEMARGVASPLLIADTMRELAKLYGTSGRTMEAVAHFGEARELYRGLNARHALVETAEEERQLQAV